MPGGGSIEARRGSADEVLERHAFWRSAMSRGSSESESASESDGESANPTVSRRRSKTLLATPDVAELTAHSRSLTILVAETGVHDVEAAAAEAHRFSKPGRVGSVRLVGLGEPKPTGDAAAEYAAALAAYAAIAEGSDIGTIAPLDEVDEVDESGESESSDGEYDPEAEAKVAAFFAAELAKEQSAQRRRGSIVAHEAAAVAAHIAADETPARCATGASELEPKPKTKQKKKKKKKKKKKTSAEKLAVSQKKAEERMRAKNTAVGGGGGGGAVD